MWVHHGATLYCLLKGLSPTVARCCLLILILHIVRWSCVLSCSVSHSTAPMISVGSVVKVVSSSSSHHRRRKNKKNSTWYSTVEAVTVSYINRVQRTR
jgi:hypothetical protein